jgi:cyclase
MDPTDAPSVAEAFGRSDASELPHLIGVNRRVLFSFHDLYFHLVQAEDDIRDRLYQARGHALYQGLNGELGKFISPYDPNWKEPKDAMAKPFYTWQSH